MIKRVKQTWQRIKQSEPYLERKRQGPRWTWINILAVGIWPLAIPMLLYKVRKYPPAMEESRLDSLYFDAVILVMIAWSTAKIYGPLPLILFAGTGAALLFVLTTWMKLRPQSFLAHRMKSSH